VCGGVRNRPVTPTPTPPRPHSVTGPTLQLSENCSGGNNRTSDNISNANIGSNGMLTVVF